jgi:hypothetical protein
MRHPKCAVPGCNRLPEMVYDVDGNPKPICSQCFGRWTPLTLDTLLNVRQRDYGLEVDGRRRG